MSSGRPTEDIDGLGSLPISLGDVSDRLKELAPIRPVKRAIEQAARLAGLSYTRTFDLWYGKAHRLEPDEAAAIADALAAKNRKDLRNELHDLRTRLARLESILVQTDAEFHREHSGQMRPALR